MDDSRCIHCFLDGGDTLFLEQWTDILIFLAHQKMDPADVRPEMHYNLYDCDEVMLATPGG